MEFKGTKGKWVFDKNINGIVNENVKGLLATAWSVYNSEIYENRIEGESWLEMKKRTEYIRDVCKKEQNANSLLISKAPEMLEMLELLSQDNNLDMDTLHDIKQLIKEATELK